MGSLWKMVMPKIMKCVWVKRKEGKEGSRNRGPQGSSGHSFWRGHCTGADDDDDDGGDGDDDGDDDDDDDSGGGDDDDDGDDGAVSGHREPSLRH